MPVLVASLLALSLVGCGARAANVGVPPVDTTDLQTALQRLAKAHLEVELSGFGPLPAGYGLEGAPVGDQDPEAPTRVRRGSVVKLNMHGVAPLPSPVFLKKHPARVTVPDVVGLPWRAAVRKLLNPGFWIRIGKVPPLGPVEPREVFADYVVTALRPRPGTRLVWGGTRIPHGLHVTVVEVEVGRR